MSQASPFTITAASIKAQCGLPVVIIGNGPVGMRVAQELLNRAPSTALVIYGEEQHRPYNRVKLSAWLAGEIDSDALHDALTHPAFASVDERIGFRVTEIDSEQKFVIDSSNVKQPFQALIIATGSKPFIPNIPGVDISGVYSFRNYADTNKLLARRASSHHCVVLGGGLLGLEAARAMQKLNTEVTLIEHADRLLSNQLDVAGAELLHAQVESLGINVIIGDGVSAVLGTERITGLRLRNGRELACDTLILATGITPNIELAQQASLAFSRGILVNDEMQTSVKDIYAVGECAEHRERIYGLVAPGLEQAAVAAANITGTETHYSGSMAASRLKVVGTQVFSIGPMGINEVSHFGSSYIYHDADAGIYRKILVHRYRLVGVIGYGEWAETVRLQTAVSEQVRIYPWQILRFLKTGLVWPEEEAEDVNAWPANALVCQCMNVTRGTISDAIQNGACRLSEVSQTTGASTVCGSCKPLVASLLGNDHVTEPVRYARSMLTFAAITVATITLFFLAIEVPYASSVQHEWRWDILWRDSLYKQISGFTVLGLAVLGLALSIKKRVRKLDGLGAFDYWRLAHIMLGVLVIATLVAHTGFRMGEGLNFYLMLSFSSMIVLGALSSTITALEHKLKKSSALIYRKRSVLWHIFLFWPVPGLLAWHVLKGYWY